MVPLNRPVTAGPGSLNTCSPSLTVNEVVAVRQPSLAVTVYAPAAGGVKLPSVPTVPGGVSSSREALQFTALVASVEPPPTVALAVNATVPSPLAVESAGAIDSAVAPAMQAATPPSSSRAVLWPQWQPLQNRSPPNT